MLFIVKSCLQKLNKGVYLFESKQPEAMLLLNRVSVPVGYGCCISCSETQQLCSGGKKDTSEAVWREVESTTEKSSSVPCP